MNRAHLRETPLLDHGQESIGTLIRARGWQSLPAGQRIGAAYAFVRCQRSPETA